MDDNALGSWEEVLRLSVLPSLAKLHVSGNPLTDVWYPSTQEAGCLAFSSLEALFMGHCQLASWPCVSQLDRFPQLRELRLSHNPFLADAKSGGRYEVRRFSSASQNHSLARVLGAHMQPSQPQVH